MKWFPMAAMLLFAGSLGSVRAETPPVMGQVVCHGDSLTWGANATSGTGTPGILREEGPAGPAPEGTTYPAALARTLGPAWRVRSHGTGGWTISLLTGDAPTKIDPLFDPSLPKNVLIIFAGTNDLGGSHESAGTAFDKLVAYCGARRAAHPWKIMVVTIPMAAYPHVYPPDFDAQAVQYDGLIRRNWRRFADGIIDIQADPRFGAPGAEYNLRYFKPNDFTHLTDAGYKIVGEAAAKAVVAAATHTFVAARSLATGKPPLASSEKGEMSPNSQRTATLGRAGNSTRKAAYFGSRR